MICLQHAKHQGSLESDILNHYQRKYATLFELPLGKNEKVREN